MVIDDDQARANDTDAERDPVNIKISNVVKLSVRTAHELAHLNRETLSAEAAGVVAGVELCEERLNTYLFADGDTHDTDTADARRSSARRGTSLRWPIWIAGTTPSRMARFRRSTPMPISRAARGRLRNKAIGCESFMSITIVQPRCAIYGIRERSG
jgi:hypothetical protein